MKNNKYLIICLAVLIIIGAVTFILFKRNKSDEKIDDGALFVSSKLKEDYYVYDDHVNDILYENKINVPKYMTRIMNSLTVASYIYKDNDISLSLQYMNVKDKDGLEKYINGLTFEKEDSHYIYKSDKEIKVYFENPNGYYQTIDIKIVSDTRKLDDSYTNLLKDFSTTKKTYKDYALKKEKGYYVGTITNNYYNNESDSVSVSANYKVSSEKYGSVYNPDYKYLEAYLDKSSISFYEGEITADLDTVQKQTRIRMYTSKITNLDIEKEAVEDLKWPLNQPAFKDVTKDNVKLVFDSFEYRGKEVKYYNASSSNNNSYGERIYAYYPITDDVYYIIQIFGGVDKKLDTKSMVEEFLPETFESSIKGVK